MTSKATKAARGQTCQVRAPGICNWNPETVVFAHAPIGAGMGQKSNLDSEGKAPWGAFACSACHDALDGRTQILERADKAGLWLDAIKRTQTIFFQLKIFKC